MVIIEMGSRQRPHLQHRLGPELQVQTQAQSLHNPNPMQTPITNLGLVLTQTQNQTQNWAQPQPKPKKNQAFVFSTAPPPAWKSSSKGTPTASGTKRRCRRCRRLARLSTWPEQVKTHHACVREGAAGGPRVGLLQAMDDGGQGWR